MEGELRVGVGEVRSLTFQAKAASLVELQLPSWGSPMEIGQPHRQFRVIIQVSKRHQNILCRDSLKLSVDRQKMCQDQVLLHVPLKT